MVPSAERVRAGRGVGSPSAAREPSSADLRLQRASGSSATPEPVARWHVGTGGGLLLIPVIICVGLITFVLLTSGTDVVDVRPAEHVCQRGGALC